ncbi:hypothetical protein [Microtetraspora niveoalba]|uniref:hypothetical protein n=1 Tax=Microtetraspora niveoalba TaxID=46175 RepID=UPI0008339A54|nr:hypothetical protein [Microtetraspora niveoalba]
MSSRHELTTSTFRPEQAELDDARPLVPPGKTMDGLLRATLRALAADPQRLLDVLGPHWPAEKRRGRPPKQPAAE